MGLKPHFSHFGWLSARVNSCPVTVRVQSEVLRQAEFPDPLSFLADRYLLRGDPIVRLGAQAPSAPPQVAAAPLVLARGWVYR